VFSPYLLLGVGYLGADADEGPQFAGNTGTDNNPTASVGLGLKWRLGQSNYSIRAEHRLRTAFDDQNLTDQLTSIGVQYNFGGSRQVISLPDPDIDTDGDGVPDIRDPCPNTKPGVEVDAFGCERRTTDRDAGGDRVFDNDQDRDRVFDNIDECPNTPPGVPVDSRGCSLDSDMDGVTTDKDFCPATRAGAVVDEFGCEADDDQDGVVNQRDRCPGTPRGARVDTNGCEA
jgi:OOP family OmpA-OmpF porin